MANITITEYSLDTPKYNKIDNILNARIIDMIKRENNMIGGFSTQDKPIMSNCIVLIISIIIIIVGIYLSLSKNDFVSTIGQVQNIVCDSSDSSDSSNSSNFFNFFDYPSKCKFNLTYTVKNTQYSKIISIDKLSIPQTDQIEIYYKESEPNIIYLYNYNFYLIGLGLIFAGLFMLISSCNN